MKHIIDSVEPWDDVAIYVKVFKGRQLYNRSFATKKSNLTIDFIKKNSAREEISLTDKRN